MSCKCAEKSVVWNHTQAKYNPHHAEKGRTMTPAEKLATALELFRQLQEKDQIICLENLRRLAAGR